MSEQNEPRYFTLYQGAWIPTSEWNTRDQRGGSDKMLLAKGVRFVLRDDEYWTFGALGFPLNKGQEAIVVPLLAEAEPRIGQWIDSGPATCESILAAMGELGIVTEDDIRRAADYVVEQDGIEFGAIEHRNWVVSSPEA
jgi:hypothetical protein